MLDTDHAAGFLVGGGRVNWTGTSGMLSPISVGLARAGDGVDLFGCGRDRVRYRRGDHPSGGHPPSEAAPAALASTFVTSVVGVVAFTVLAANHYGRPPDWPTGILLGIGGLAGGYAGARLQHRVPEAVIRRGLEVVVVAVGAVFLVMGLSRAGH
jgi:hypothetical protein